MEHTHSRRQPWLTLATVVATCLAALPWFISFGPVTGEKGGLVAAVAVTFIPAWLLLVASRNTEMAPRLRQALLLLGFSMLAVSVGNLLRLARALGAPLPTIPIVSTGSNLLIWAVGLAALLRIPLKPVAPGTRWRMCTDVAIAGIGITLAIFFVWSLPGFRGAPGTMRWEIMMYNGMELGNIIVLNLVLVRGTHRSLRRAVWWLAATVVIETVYLVSLQYGIGKQSPDHRLTNSLFFIDYLAYTYAAFHFLRDGAPVGEAASKVPGIWALNPLPVCAVLGIGALLILSAVHHADAGILALAIGIVAMSVLLLARVMLSTLESMRVVREKAERETQVQAEKLDLTRHLSGGIAHVINNMMTVVLGHAELLRVEAPPDSLARGSLDAITSAAYRVSTLASRLELASGQRDMDEGRTRLVEAVLLQRDSVNRMVGQRRDVIWDLTGAGGNALVAPSDMETIMRELVSNAGEATFHGGKITIRVREETLSTLPTGMSPCPPEGTYSMLEVADTGRGIPESDLPHVVEPFFTKSPRPEGRGLGLSIVHGIVASYGGGLLIDTVPGSGSRVRVYLPAA